MSLPEELNLLAPRLRRFARALVSGEPVEASGADALVGATLRRFFESADPQGQRDLDLSAYAWLINLNRDQIRATEPAPASFGPAHATTRASGGSAAEWRATEKAASAPVSTDYVSSALCALKLEEREALLLVVLEGFSYAEAARILKISRPLLVARLARARDRLPKTLHERPAERRVKPHAPYLRVIK